jgi:parvulin-like peptidyl-prolyl isomerase
MLPSDWYKKIGKKIIGRHKSYAQLNLLTYRAPKWEPGTHMKARHILVDHEHEALDLLKKIEGGEKFETLAQKFSKCPSSRNGGDLGEFGRGRMVPSFEEAAFALEIDQVSKPVRTQFGYHLIQRYQ